VNARTGHGALNCSTNSPDSCRSARPMRRRRGPLFPRGEAFGG
jgi:hypothetical protein